MSGINYIRLLPPTFYYLQIAPHLAEPLSNPSILPQLFTKLSCWPSSVPAIPTHINVPLVSPLLQKRIVPF